jgi:hypothetical protein
MINFQRVKIIGMVIGSHGVRSEEEQTGRRGEREIASLRSQ